MLSLTYEAEKQTSKDRGLKGTINEKTPKLSGVVPESRIFLQRQVEFHPFKLHPIFKFERLGAFATLKKMG